MTTVFSPSFPFFVSVHRGLHGEDYPAPENSMAAFRQTAGEGLGIELDVRLTRDGQVVVHHDARLGRVFEEKDKPGWSKPIHELDHADLQNAVPRQGDMPKPSMKHRIEYAVLKKTHPTAAPEFNAEQPPLLRDVIGMLKSTNPVPLLVELKVLSEADAPGLNKREVAALNRKLGEETARVLHETGYEENSILIGFDGAMLKYAKQADKALHEDADDAAGVKTGYIPFTALLPARLPGVRHKRDTLLRSLGEGFLCRKLPYRQGRLERLLKTWRDEWQLDAVLPSYGQVNRQFMETARNLGLAVLPGRCWESAEAEEKEAARMKELGADGIVVTHRPREIALNLLSQG